MSESDPHIHVERDVMRAGAGYRNLVVSIFGKAPDSPGVVVTGCGVQVPYVMTSTRPESVTCLGCREHARREYLRYAEQVERLGRMPGAPFGGEDAVKAARWAREHAGKFSG